MQLNTTQPPSSQQLTYVELVHQNGDQHTLVMWLIMGQKCALSLVGILLNAILVAATVKLKNLRSTCNLLIALDSTFLALYQLSTFITLLPSIFGINFMPIWLCFYLQMGPYFGVLMSFCLMLQIGLERLTCMLFPIWSRSGKSKRLHTVFFVFSAVSNCYLLWLEHEITNVNNSMILCYLVSIRSASAVGVIMYSILFYRSMIMHVLLVIIYIALFAALKFKKENQHFSKSIFHSLVFLIFLDIIGWLPTLFLDEFLKITKFSPVMASYISTGFSTISSGFAASANGPTLYYFNRIYREEINAFLWKKVGTQQQQQQQQQQQHHTNANALNNNWIH